MRFISILILLGLSFQISAAPRATNGNLDARQWDFETSSIPLSGEWQIFKDKGNRDYEQEGDLITLPGPWKGSQYKGKPIKRFGRFKYRLVIQMPKSEKPFGVSFHFYRGAMVLYQNGVILAQSGRLSGEEVSPGKFSKSICKILHFQ